MSYKTMVHAALEDIGLDPYGCWDGEGWQYNHASMPVTIRAIDNEESISIIIATNKIPHQNLLPLYRQLLEINMNTGVAKICAVDDLIVVCTSRPIEGLDMNELLHLISMVSAVARGISSDLENTFGAKSLHVN